MHVAGHIEYFSTPKIHYAYKYWKMLNVGKRLRRVLEIIIHKIRVHFCDTLFIQQYLVYTIYISKRKTLCKNKGVHAYSLVSLCH